MPADQTSDEVPYNAPLGPWDQAWRYLLAGAVSTLSWWEVSQLQWAESRPMFFTDLALGLVAFVLVGWRRRLPLTIAVVTSLFGAASALSAGPAMLAFVSLATRREISRIIPVAVLGIVTGQLFYSFQPQADDLAPWLNLTWLVIITVAMTATGMYVGSRRELVWSLQERARAAESEQELRVDQARSSERERIAREMHDVLAHRISLVSMHAGALAYRDDLSREEVRETAELINTASHEALTELREVLGALRSEEAVRPQPSYADIADLIEEDDRVECDDQVSVPVPDRIGRTAYRVVQEALTNARRYAPGEQVLIVLDGGPGEGLSVAVRNAMPRVGQPSPGSGLGLIGMRERLTLLGGRLDSRVVDGSFELSAWLPWPA